MGQENPNDQPPPPPPTIWQRLGERIKNTPGSGIAFAVIPLLIIGYFGWYYFGAEHLDRTLYAVKLENIDLTPQPPWIRSDLKAQVFRENQLSQVSLLDPQATATIAHAFDAHNWIKSTNRVRKMSGGKIIVDVTYRKPAAMVYCEKTPGARGAMAGKVCYPVDEEGVVLPGDEFAATQVYDYFIIVAPEAAPAGKTGGAFGDPRINEALLLCKVLEPVRDALRLAYIDVLPDAMDVQLGGFNSWVMLITTKDNREIIWGHAPTKESKDEMPIDEKMATLNSWLQSPASASTGSQVLDLRHRRNAPQRMISSPGNRLLQNRPAN